MFLSLFSVPLRGHPLPVLCVCSMTIIAQNTEELCCWPWSLRPLSFSREGHVSWRAGGLQNMRDVEQAGPTLQTKPNPVRFSQGWPNLSLYTHVCKQEINAYFCKHGVPCRNVVESSWLLPCKTLLIMEKRLLVRDFVQSISFLERTVNVKKEIDQIMTYAWYQLERLNLPLHVYF